MSAREASLKLEHQYQDQKWANHFKVIEIEGKIYVSGSGSNAAFLRIGDDVNQKELECLKSKDGSGIKIEVVDLLGESMTEDFFPAGEVEEGDPEDEKIIFLAEYLDPDKYILRKISKKGEIETLKPDDFNEGIDTVLEFIRDCVGIASVDFEDSCFVLGIDQRASLGAILEDLEDWLDDCIDGAVLKILTPDDFIKRWGLPGGTNNFLSHPRQPSLFQEEGV